MESYTDFFYVTHGKVPKYIQEIKKKYQDMDNNKMQIKCYPEDKGSLSLLRKQLIIGEDYLLDERYYEAITNYNQLASMFLDEKLQLYHEAAYFYHKSIDICKKKIFDVKKINKKLGIGRLLS